MKNPFLKTLKFATAGLSFALCLVAGHLRAAITYWDPQGTNLSGTSTYYTNSLSGTWENKSWSTNTAGAGMITPTNFVESTAVCFGVDTGLGTPPFSVLMGANHTVGGFFIGSENPNSCSATVYGSGIMTLPSGLAGFVSHNASDHSLGILIISNTIAGVGILTPEEEGQIYLDGSNSYTGGTSLGYSGTAWEGFVYFNNTNAFGTGTIYTSNCLGGSLVLEGSSALTITNPIVMPATVAPTLSLLGNAAGLTFSGPWTISAAATLDLGSTSNNISTNYAINVSQNPVTISGVITGSGSITITNASTNTASLTLTANNTYTGNTTIGSSTLYLAFPGSISNSPTITVDAAGVFDVSSYAPSPYVLNSKQTLTGFGTVNGDVLVGATAKISGGTSTSIGTLTNNGSTLLQGGGTNIVYMQNALTGAGVGYSSFTTLNNIGVLANSGSPFTIKLVSITGTGAAGSVSNFDRTVSYSWTIATGNVTNFDPTAFTIDMSGFANLFFGQFSISNSAAGLALNYNPQTNVVISAQTPTNNLTLFVGQNYLLSVTAGGLGPLTYQWYTNGVADATAGTNTTYLLSSVQLPQSGETFQSIVTGADTTATNALVALTVLPWPADAYSSNVMTLTPVAYWPMHEVEAPAQGDIETNYGTLGLLGTGYYPDWLGGGAAIQRGFPGAITNDSDTAVYFSDPASTVTNALYVPHTSPLSTLNPPFSVECWMYPTSSIVNDVWSQNGYEGLNAGASSGGNGNIAGIRLYAGGTGITVYTYKTTTTAQAVISIATGFTNQWTHVVVTCDANTNISLYTNGVLVATSSAVGLYTPDYWTPFEVGNGRGNSRACAAIVDEVAIYPTNLGASDILQHYTDGTTEPQAGVYVSDVLNDTPTVYLRMDSSAYTRPPVAAWPILTNYGILPAGTVVNNGVYSPGTVPGIVAGPNVNGFAFAGTPGVDVPELSGVSSFADAGFQTAYNPVGRTAFSVSAMFRGDPCDNRIQEIVGHSTNSWGIVMSTNGTVQCELGTNLNSLVISTNVLNDGNWHQVVEVYKPASGVTVTGTNYLYVDGILNKVITTVSTNGILPGSTQDVIIGSDPMFTNNPVGVGRQFSGQVCEVALFTNALTAAQVSALYVAAGGTGPSVGSILPLVATNISGAGTYTNFSVTVNGTAPFAYQWYFNTASNYTGAIALQNNANYANVTSNQLVITNLITADTGWYYAVVTNDYGMATSALAGLTVLIPVNSNPTNIVFSLASNQLTLSWPADHTGWILQAQTNSLSVGISTNWVNISGSTLTNQIVIPINLTNGGVFYRLMYNP